MGWERRVNWGRQRERAIGGSPVGLLWNVGLTDEWMSREGEWKQRVSDRDKRIQRGKRRWLRDQERMSRKNHGQVPKGTKAGCPHSQSIPVYPASILVSQPLWEILCWLLKNIDSHIRRTGFWGKRLSRPGFTQTSGSLSVKEGSGDQRDDLSSSDIPGFQGQPIFPELGWRERRLRAWGLEPTLQEHGKRQQL